MHCLNLFFQWDNYFLSDSYFLFLDAFDTEKLLNCMENLMRGQAVDVPNYDFKNHKSVFPARKVSGNQLTLLAMFTRGCKFTWINHLACLMKQHFVYLLEGPLYTRIHQIPCLCTSFDKKQHYYVLVLISSFYHIT